MKINNKSLTFILGCQRSGTTWLTNIFEASSDSIVFMEPFAPPTRLFPKFPKTNLFLEESNKDLDRLIQKDFPRKLLIHKSLVPNSSLCFPNFFPIERKISTYFKNYNYKGLPNRLKSHLMKFYALNYHKMESAFPTYFKHRQPQFWVVKELRLAGKIPIFTKNFPDAHYVSIIRHPVATVNSILNWFERKHLVELQCDISNYINDLETQPISKLYIDEFEICKKGGLVHTLALYWRISYETIISKLLNNYNLHVIVYEELINEPKKTVSNLFNNIGIPWSSAVDDYLSFSTSKNVQQNNPISTIRKSLDYKYWMEQISSQNKKGIFNVVKNSFLLPYFDPYY